MENNNIAEKFLDKISNMSKIWIWVSMCLWIICFIIAIWLLYYVIFNSKIELNWENIVYILWWLFFSWLVLIILPLYFWKINKDIQEKIIKEEIKKEEKMKWIISILKDLQENFKKIDFLESCDINNEVKFWKDIFKIKNNTKITIVCAIDEETWKIHNFYIRSSSKEIRDKILDYKNIDKEYNKNLGYNFTHLVYKETEEMCEIWEYEKAINFLIDILENTFHYTNKKTD